MTIDEKLDAHIRQENGVLVGANVFVNHGRDNNTGETGVLIVTTFEEMPILAIAVSAEQARAIADILYMHAEMLEQGETVQ